MKPCMYLHLQLKQFLKLYTWNSFPRKTTTPLSYIASLVVNYGISNTIVLEIP